MATFEFLRIVKEKSLGTIMDNPVAGTDEIYLRLTESNSFTVQPTPVFVDIMYGGGENIVNESISDYFNLTGRLQTVLYPTQAAMLFGWLTTRINDARSSPWTTTEPAGDLASVSIYHAYQTADGTIKRTRYAGCKPTGWTLELTRQAPVARISIDLAALKPYGNAYDNSADPDATEFPAPVDSDYPTGPYRFNQTSGGLLLGSSAGTVRTQYENISVQCTHTLDVRSFETAFNQVLAFRGRRMTINANMRLKITPDDRAAFESAAKQRVQLTITSGTHSVVIDGKSFNTIRQLTRDLPIDRTFMYNAQWQSARDPSANVDFTVTCT